MSIRSEQVSNILKALLLPGCFNNFIFEEKFSAYKNHWLNSWVCLSILYAKQIGFISIWSLLLSRSSYKGSCTYLEHAQRYFYVQLFEVCKNI